ncbi:MAG TPA: ABC transporter, partial [Pseudoxanthomonas sp.]|nr:ABC transporter [Pseudoxanthomonas sp.]
AGQAVPSATIEVNAKLMRMRDQRIVATRTFLQAQPAAGVEVPQVATAFEQALSAITRDLAGWSLQSGQTDASTQR